MIKLPASFAAPGLGTEAVLEYTDADFRIVRHGTFVRCAVTGEPIALEDLHYWNVATQEAYSGPAAIMERLRAAKAS